MGKIVTFGEVMLRLAPEGYLSFFQNDKLGATFGGGEANVAVSLANFGLNAAFVTKLPKHADHSSGQTKPIVGEIAHAAKAIERIGCN